MSLPLTRRIARAALLIAAGAAPVVGAAGSASAVELPQSPLGGLTALDTDSLGNTVDGAAQKATGTAGDTGAEAVKKTVPAAGKTVGKSGKSAPGTAKEAAGDTAGNAADVVGETAGTATESLGGETAGTATQSLGGLPVGSGLPTEQLPVTSPL
ncbi:ATP-binding protein [Streptomyces sp. NPDC005407]|uniref:ATP-binding protein n=1 Tax=Streptomyces sp. NPDC005407 TaxID=3155340 RepID=UPI0033B40DC5